MKERTKQYNWPITRVFDFNYTDFQPESSRLAIISLAWVQKRTAIIYAQFKNSEIFAGPGINTAQLWLADEDTAFPFTNISAAFITCDLTFPVEPTHGCARSIPLRELPGHPNLQPIILNHTFGAELFLVLQINPGQAIDNLNAGSGTVWFTYIRLR